MTRGLLRLSTLGGEHFLKVPEKFRSFRLFSGNVKLQQKDGKPAEILKGIEYKNLTIGVPKEKWANERRFVQFKYYSIRLIHNIL